jgi:very-short-patch-repair endonuclease
LQPNETLSFAKKLRQEMTEAEKRLWFYLKNNQIGHKFRRQEPIGKYIVDFVCYDLKIIIELDGGQHTEEKDRIRSLFFTSQGFKLLRFWNNDVLDNTDGVMQEILAALPPHPDLLPQGEKEQKEKV